MADFILPLESSEEAHDYNVESAIMENMASETRLISSGKLINVKCKSPALTSAQAQAYIAFFDSKFGSLTSFTYASRMDGLEYTVRFVKGSFKITNEKGYHRCEFSLERVF